MPVDVSVLTALEATSALDAFSYSAGLLTSVGGGLWTAPILSGETDGLNADGGGLCIFSLVNTTVSAYRNDQTFGPTLAAMLTLTEKPDSDDGSFLIAFLQGSGLGSGTPQGYAGEIRIRTTGDEWRIRKFDGLGSSSVLSSGTIQEIANGDKWAFVRAGNNLEIWWKTGSTWTFIVETSDSSYTSAKNIGITLLGLGNGNNPSVDDLKAMTFTLGTTLTPTVGATTASGIAPARVVGTIKTPTTP